MACLLPRPKWSSVCKLCQQTSLRFFHSPGKAVTGTAVRSSSNLNLQTNYQYISRPNTFQRRAQSTVAVGNPIHTVLEDQDNEQREKKSLNLLEKVKNAIMEDQLFQRIFAVVHLGGRQHKITANDIIMVHKLPAKCGEKIKFQKVLMAGGREFSLIGKPLLSTEQVHIEATVLEKTKGRKIIVFKKKRRKNYKKWKGHRQELTVLRINKIKINPSTLDAQATQDS